MFIQVWQIKEAIWFERDASEKVLAVNSDKTTVIIIIIAWTFFRWALIGRFTYALWRRGIFVCVHLLVVFDLQLVLFLLVYFRR